MILENDYFLLGVLMFIFFVLGYFTGKMAKELEEIKQRRKEE